MLKQSVDNTPAQQQQQQESSQQAQLVEEKPVGKKVELRVSKNPQQQQQQQVELRVNKNPLRPRPRSVAVPNVEAVRADEVKIYNILILAKEN